MSYTRLPRQLGRRSSALRGDHAGRSGRSRAPKRSRAGHDSAGAIADRGKHDHADPDGARLLPSLLYRRFRPPTLTARRACLPSRPSRSVRSNGFPAAYNYPNPFSPLRGGTNIVFNAPPSGYSKATVEVYSEWQDLLFKQDYFNIPPGVSQIPFNGHDRYGRPFFNGSYICRVRFSGPDDQTIFYLLVVK